MSKNQFASKSNLAEFQRFCDHIGSLTQETGLSEQLLNKLLSDGHVRPLLDDLA